MPIQSGQLQISFTGHIFQARATGQKIINLFGDLCDLARGQIQSHIQLQLIAHRVKTLHIPIQDGVHTE